MAELAGWGEAQLGVGLTVLGLMDFWRRMSCGRSGQEVGKRYPRLANMS